MINVKLINNETNMCWWNSFVKLFAFFQCALIMSKINEFINKHDCKHNNGNNNNNHNNNDNDNNKCNNNDNNNKCKKLCWYCNVFNAILTVINENCANSI